MPTSNKTFAANHECTRGRLGAETSVTDHEDSIELDRSRPTPTHSIAVEFIDMPHEGREALSEFTLLIQGVLL